MQQMRHMQRFKLAPMSTLLWTTTAIAVVVPVVLLQLAVRLPAPLDLIFAALTLAIVALLTAVALFARPARFEIDRERQLLHLVWPLRRRTISLSAIKRARVLDRAAMRMALGRPMRVGAGGFLGGFGRALTARGTTELWVSREDWCVLIERADGGRDLIVTPAEPAEFVAALRM